MWTRCGVWAKAGEEALRAKDAATLEGLAQKAPIGEQMELERMLRQLRPNK